MAELLVCYRVAVVLLIFSIAGYFTRKIITLVVMKVSMESMSRERLRMEIQGEIHVRIESLIFNVHLVAVLVEIILIMD